ncbi:MAG: hypothetical protein KAH21_08120 [Spirochaetaceae bacterium]|nr:hypothetical protein [Spirochaetaceae bacterium]
MKPENKTPREADNISRKEAMKKAGKYAAFTAASMLFLFSPLDAQTDSEWPDDPGWDW